MALVGLAFAVSACSGGPGDESDLVAALTRDDTFTTAEAECIANAVFLEYGEDEDALNLISGASSYEELTGPDGVEGFNDVFDGAISACSS